MVEFTQGQRREMAQCFGDSFVKALPVRLANYAERWGLSNFSLIEYYSVNCLFLCYSSKFGDCVLKVFGCDYGWYIDEIRVLRELNGRCGYIHAYECDEENGALLLERIKPGTTLKLEPSLEKRVAIFTDIWKNSRIAPHDLTLYKSYIKTTEDAAKWQFDYGENPDLKRLSALMTSVCGNLYDRYEARVLLHADLHGDNLLKDTHGKYRIVDPHGRIGPPICDLGRYIANEYADAEYEARCSITESVIIRLSEALKLPKIDIVRAFFVDITLMACWDAEDGTTNLDGVLYAESLLQQHG